jgi:hypothetical protein
VKRRSFLQILGGGVLGGRKAAENAILAASGMKVGSAGGMVAIGQPSEWDPLPPTVSGSAGGQTGNPGPGNISRYQQRLIKASNYLKGLDMVGVKTPQFIEDQWRENARYAPYLDLDIAIKCWSPSVKLQAQRQRNYERIRHDALAIGSRITAKSVFEKLVGWDWPWN